MRGTGGGIRHHLGDVLVGGHLKIHCVLVSGRGEGELGGW
jgi:hypothetical protein